MVSNARASHPSLGGSKLKSPNAFMLWTRLSQRRRQLTQCYPETHQSEISRLLGKEWRALSPALRRQYFLLSDQYRDLNEPKRNAVRRTKNRSKQCPTFISENPGWQTQMQEDDEINTKSSNSSPDSAVNGSAACEAASASEHAAHTALNELPRQPTSSSSPSASPRLSLIRRQTLQQRHDDTVPHTFRSFSYSIPSGPPSSADKDLPWPSPALSSAPIKKVCSSSEAINGSDVLSRGHVCCAPTPSENQYTRWGRGGAMSRNLDSDDYPTTAVGADHKFIARPAKKVLVGVATTHGGSGTDDQTIGAAQLDVETRPHFSFRTDLFQGLHRLPSPPFKSASSPTTAPAFPRRFSDSDSDGIGVCFLARQSLLSSPAQHALPPMSSTSHRAPQSLGADTLLPSLLDVAGPSLLAAAAQPLYSPIGQAIPVPSFYDGSWQPLQARLPASTPTPTPTASAMAEACVFSGRDDAPDALLPFWLSRASVTQASASSGSTSCNWGIPFVKPMWPALCSDHESSAALLARCVIGEDGHLRLRPIQRGPVPTPAASFDD